MDINKEELEAYFNGREVRGCYVGKDGQDMVAVDGKTFIDLEFRGDYEKAFEFAKKEAQK